MKSYASVDRVEGEFAVCEVELLEVENSRAEDYFAKETTTINIPLGNFSERIGVVEEGDIIVIEHDGENLICFYHKDNAEKQRRIEVLKKIMEG